MLIRIDETKLLAKNAILRIIFCRKTIQARLTSKNILLTTLLGNIYTN